MKNAPSQKREKRGQFGNVKDPLSSFPLMDAKAYTFT